MYIKLHSFLGNQDPVNGRLTEMSTYLSLTTIEEVIIPVAKLICELCQHCSLGFGLISLLCGFVLNFFIIIIIFFYSSWSVNIGVVNLLAVD